MSKNITKCAMFSKLLSDYVDNELSKTEAKLLLEHTQKCEPCNIKMQNLLKIKEMIKTNFACNAPEIDLSKNIMAKIKLGELTRKNQKKSSPKVLRFFAIAAVTLFAISATILYSQSENKKLLAQKNRFDSYAVEHSATIIYDEPMVQSANYSLIMKDK